MYECDPAIGFDDNNLPEGVCDNIYQQIGLCLTNIAGGWAVGGDDVSYQNQVLIEKYLIRIDIGVSRDCWISSWR